MHLQAFYKLQWLAAACFVSYGPVATSYYMLAQGCYVLVKALVLLVSASKGFGKAAASTYSCISVKKLPWLAATSCYGWLLQTSHRFGTAATA